MLTLSNANPMPLDIEILIPEVSPALEQPVGKEITTLLTTEKTMCSKDLDNSHAMSNGRLISDGINCLEIIPDCYIRPPNERPRLKEVVLSDFIPLVDLDNLNGSARHTVIRNMKHACQQYGFFQVLFLSIF